MSISLDGFIEAPNRELDWHRVDEELHRHFNQELAKMSAFLEGRVIYELMEGYWPTAGEDPSSTAVEIEFAGIWRAMPKVVYSRTLKQVGPNATLVRDVIPEEVAKLKAQSGGDMALGGAELGAAFRALDLIDEYRIYVHPVLIGKGKPLFQEAEAVSDLRLLETHGFGNGVVLLHYARA
jgi:dihydrofolate reductase